MFASIESDRVSELRTKTRNPSLGRSLETAGRSDKSDRRWILRNVSGQKGRVRATGISTRNGYCTTGPSQMDRILQ